MMRAYGLLAILWSSVLLTGCGGSSNLTPLSGTVTVGGKPLTGASGAVTFVPSGGGPSSAGSLKNDGTFTVSTGALPGIAPGDYQVGVTALTPVSSGGRDAPPEIPKALIPARFADPKTSNLKYTIKSGQGKQDIALEEK